MSPAVSQGTRTIGVTPLARISLRHGGGGFIADDTVLQIDSHGIVALLRHDLGSEGIADRKPAVKPGLPSAQRRRMPLGVIAGSPRLGRLAGPTFAASRNPVKLRTGMSLAPNSC